MHDQAILVVDKIGRRVLLIVSSLVMGLSLYGLGTFFYVKDNEDIVCPEDAVIIFLNCAVCVISHTSFFFQDDTCVPQSGKFDSDTVDDLGILPLISLMIYAIAFAIGEATCQRKTGAYILDTKIIYYLYIMRELNIEH